MNTPATIIKLDDGRYSVIIWGPLFYTRDYSHAVIVRNALNKSESARDNIRAIISGADYEHVKHSMVLSVARRAALPQFV